MMSSTSSLHQRIDIKSQDIPEGSVLSNLKAENYERYHDFFKLDIPKDVFVRGVLAKQVQDDIEVRFEDEDNELQKGKSASKILDGIRIDGEKYTPLELKALREERKDKTRWQLLKSISGTHRALLLTCFYAAFTQGWDQAATAGATIELSQASEFDRHIYLGLFVGLPFLSGGILGFCLMDPIANVSWIGRRGTIAIAALCSLISMVVVAAVPVHNSLLIGLRILLGLGMAGKAALISIIISETSPSKIRASLLVCWQFFVAIGILVGSAVNWGLYSLNPNESWRYMFLAAAAPAFTLLQLIYLFPETPRWYLKKSARGFFRVQTGKEVDDRSASVRKAYVRKAWQALVQLRPNTSLLILAGEFYHLHATLLSEQKYFEEGNAEEGTRPNDPLAVPLKHYYWGKRLQLLIRYTRSRRSLYAAASVMIAQQLCGINLLAFLANSTFRAAYFADTSSNNPSDANKLLKDNMKLLSFSFGFGFANVLGTVVTWYVISKGGGRRILLNWSFAGMTLFLVIATTILKAPRDSNGRLLHNAAQNAQFAMVFFFSLAYSFGEGPMAFVISAEVFPLANRELGMSLAVFFNFVGAGLLGMFALQITAKLGGAGVLGLFTGLNVLAWFLCYWLVPDIDDNMALEDVYARLHVPADFAFCYALAKLWRMCRNLCKWKQGRAWKVEHKMDSINKAWQKSEEWQGHGSSSSRPTNWFRRMLFDTKNMVSSVEFDRFDPSDPGMAHARENANHTTSTNSSSTDQAATALESRTTAGSGIVHGEIAATPRVRSSTTVGRASGTSLYDEP